MNWKQVLLGAAVFWLVTNVVGMFATGPLIHEGLLDPDYQAHSHLWIPELNQDPPDIGAILPKWMILSFITSLVVAGVYSCVKSSFAGAGWRRGLLWGICVALLAALGYLSLTGIVAMPTKIALWWSIDAVILYALGGAAMGWAVGRWTKD